LIPQEATKNLARFFKRGRLQRDRKAHRREEQEPRDGRGNLDQHLRWIAAWVAVASVDFGPSMSENAPMDRDFANPAPCAKLTFFPYAESRRGAPPRIAGPPPGTAIGLVNALCLAVSRQWLG